MSYDVIVVGARCAGSPTAMLLARKGYKVLVVDKAAFPSDTLSTHMVHPPGVAALKRWGLLDRVAATGCPPITRYKFDFGRVVLEGNPGTSEMPVSYGPRRTVLDKILVEGAAEAGVDVREEFTVDEILIENGRVTGIRGHGKNGASVTERAKVTVGADGRFSKVAEAVKPEAYNEAPPILAGYYSYWSNLPTEGRFENYALPHRGCALFGTNDGLTLLVGGWPMTEFETNKKDAEANWMKMFDMHPALAERIRAAKRETKLFGTYVPNYFRKPYGDGWALVGDAGYNRDFITAMGITDAFLSADLCAEALDRSLGGAEPYNETMAKYQYQRDERVTPIFHFTCQLATCEPPPPQVQQIFGAMAGNQEQMDAFARMNAACLSPAEFFSEENVGKIFGAASTRQL
ncbi:MAG TPA: NAD(P)/FAD-dependent oxidoreductase [Candidatus Eisenbacteria bacterium]|nr:NAD(P)/FAD-dependent oxidoreductase [Candidatus Eisenbacteria bacterium]